MERFRSMLSICALLACIYLVKAGGKKETSKSGQTPTSSCSGKSEKYLADYSPTDPVNKTHCDYYICNRKKGKYVKETCPENQAVSKLALERAAATKAQSVQPCVNQPGACLAGEPKGTTDEGMGGGKKETSKSGQTPTSSCTGKREKYLADYSPTDPVNKTHCDYYVCNKKKGKYVKETCPENQAVSKLALERAAATKAQSVHPCVNQPGACMAGEPKGTIDVDEGDGGGKKETSKSGQTPTSSCTGKREKYLADYSPTDPINKTHCDYYVCNRKKGKYVKETCPENQAVSKLALERAAATKAQSVHPCVDQPGACLPNEPRGRMGIILPIDEGEGESDSLKSITSPECDADILWVMSDACPLEITVKQDAINLVRDITQNIDFTSAQSNIDPFLGCYLSLDDTITALKERFDTGNQYGGFQSPYSYYDQKEPFPDVLVVVTDDVEFRGSADLTGRGVIAYAIGFPQGLYNTEDNNQLLEWASKAGTNNIFPVDNFQQLDDIIWGLGFMALQSLP
ncbi:unnamed protein product [Owenia fusiformis]|uniref:Uncharacterized protein n=1 Tax=Owenia fusiformis TaxID=6347 RepID=A0A8S4Q2S4_OWEFU|nr:unnamed protein product [Owenia fusiformis]